MQRLFVHLLLTSSSSARAAERQRGCKWVGDHGKARKQNRAGVDASAWLDLSLLEHKVEERVDALLLCESLNAVSEYERNAHWSNDWAFQSRRRGRPSCDLLIRPRAFVGSKRLLGRLLAGRCAESALIVT